jgi:hypothetical protein
VPRELCAWRAPPHLRRLVLIIRRIVHDLQHHRRRSDERTPRRKLTQGRDRAALLHRRRPRRDHSRHRRQRDEHGFGGVDALTAVAKSAEKLFLPRSWVHPDGVRTLRFK